MDAPPPRPSLLERERLALAAHHAALRGSSVLPPPRHAPRGTFLHGFFLPFSLIFATLRDRELRGPYLRTAMLRSIVVAVVAVLAFSGTDVEKHDGRPRVVIRRDRSAARASASPATPAASEKKHAEPVKVDLPGVHVDLDDAHGKADIVVLGQKVPVEGGDDGTSEEADADTAKAPPPSFVRRAWNGVKHGWKWLLALVGFLSAAEGVIVFFTRRYDDWMSFHTARLAAIRAEDATPKEPKVAVDLRWLYRKLRRRVRGYIVFGAGLPALLPLRLVPVAGGWLFSIALTAWAWYWLGVFTAAKSAHAWADDGIAPAPRPIRLVSERVSKPWWAAPVRPYARLWAWITRGVNAAAATFERSPAPFLGLALARAVLALPGLYLLARPIIPVAAGRLVAEADPGDRFALPDPEPQAPSARGADGSARAA